MKNDPTRRVCTWLPVLLGLMLLQACNTDEEVGPGPLIDPDLVVLHYDGDNQDAPFLPANTYEAAIRFAPSRLSPLAGSSLKEVHFFLQQLPKSLELRIYTSLGGIRPDSLVYSADIPNGLQANTWNRHILTTALPIPQKDLWVAVKFEQEVDARVLGCDIGPAVTNGDWLWDSSDNQWLPLSQRSPININWNLRAAVEP